MAYITEQSTQAFIVSNEPNKVVLYTTTPSVVVLLESQATRAVIVTRKNQKNAYFVSRKGKDEQDIASSNKEL